jgi:GTP cyclohydrolase III
MTRKHIVAAIACGLLLGGCTTTPEQRRESALEDIQSYLREGVEDPARSRDAIALLTKIEALVAQVERLREGLHADIAALNREHTTEDTALLAKVEAFRQAREPLRNEAIEKRRRMRALLTDDEWSGYARRELALSMASRAQRGSR